MRLAAFLALLCAGVVLADIILVLPSSNAQITEVHYSVGTVTTQTVCGRVMSTDAGWQPPTCHERILTGGELQKLQNDIKNDALPFWKQKRGL